MASGRACEGHVTLEHGPRVKRDLCRRVHGVEPSRQYGDGGASDAKLFMGSAETLTGRQEADGRA